MFVLPIALIHVVQEVPVDVPLVDTKQASFSRLTIRRSPFSIGGKACRNGFTTTLTSRQTPATVVYSIPDRVRRLTAQIGFNDDARVTRNPPPATYEIKVDGETVLGGPRSIVSRGRRPVNVDLDLTGKSSIEFRLSNYAAVGDPTFSFRPKPGQDEDEPEDAPPATSDNQPLLTTPRDGAVVSGDAVNLRWNVVAGARSYGVCIVSLAASEEPGDGPRIWSQTLKSTSYSFNLKDVPAGRYRWLIIAFGPRQALGHFSAERTFSVDR